MNSKKNVLLVAAGAALATLIAWILRDLRYYDDLENYS